MEVEVPLFCSPFVRSTLLLEGGDLQPGQIESLYYSSTPSNFYSKFVHNNELDGKGYDFPYDDVSANGENLARIVSGANPATI
jgi:hypothetical protein